MCKDKKAPGMTGAVRKAVGKGRGTEMKKPRGTGASGGEWETVRAGSGGRGREFVSAGAVSEIKGLGGKRVALQLHAPGRFPFRHKRKP